MKKVSVLGSTGSVGLQTLDVIADSADFQVIGLAAHSNWELLLRQAKAFGAKVVGLFDEKAAYLAKSEKGSLGLKDLEVVTGSEGLCRIASLPECDLVVHAIPGFRGVKPLLSSLESGKRVALSGKEALVSAGEIVQTFLLSDPNAVIPVDSEHSAIFQCLLGEDRSSIENLILTASGGALRDLSCEELHQIRPSDALKHPTWQMGPKVTVDSATLFNKTLEVMEAHYLFNMPYDSIKVVIHRESIIHSMVSFRDGSTKAQLANPDMRLPIAFALNFPERKKGLVETINPVLGTLTFEEPDVKRFPCLGLGYEAGRMGGTAPCVLSIADEIVVKTFLAGRLPFTEMYNVLRTVLERYEPRRADSLESLECAAVWAESEARKTIESSMRR
ncbi:MAG: 1-deoxy-D-xylulose-5-phosphate reductoisomerase [Firmicutes bacterium]|mgnify:CR=1 FL=1|nr:1-deoxy-D-xylulose-5-phosphate reductoisomerase [Candidatus Fermentithermobacillaceae bacterium]